MKSDGNFFSKPWFEYTTTHPFYSWWGLLFLLLALMAPLTLSPHPAWAVVAESTQNTLVELETEGKVQAKPDKAAFTFSVVTEAPQAQEAAKANAKEAERFLAAVKKVLGPDDKVKTSQYQVVPIFRKLEKVQGKQKIRTDEIAGYRASHHFQVELRDLEKLGLVADTALRNGATEVQGPYFSHTQQDALQNQAAVKALERARSLAEALAQAAGLKVKRVLKMRTAHTIQPRVFSMAKALPAASAEVETPIEVGEINFQASLIVTFELAP